MSRPERRKRSSLTGAHPAKPPTLAPMSAAQAPAREETSVGVDARTDFHAGVQAGVRVDARERRSDPEREQRARARTEVERAALAWGAARRKLTQREAAWIEMLGRARALGELPGVLGGFVHDAARRAGIDPAEIPAEVWVAAGLDQPSVKSR